MATIFERTSILRKLAASLHVLHMRVSILSEVATNRRTQLFALLHMPPNDKVLDLVANTTTGLSELTAMLAFCPSLTDQQICDAVSLLFEWVEELNMLLPPSTIEEAKKSALLLELHTIRDALLCLLALDENLPKVFSHRKLLRSPFFRKDEK